MRSPRSLEMRALADGDCGELVAETQVEGDLLRDAPSIIAIAVEGCFVAVVDEVACRPLAEVGREPCHSGIR